MRIDGYVIRLDYSDEKAMTAKLQKTAQTSIKLQSV